MIGMRRKSVGQPMSTGTRSGRRQEEPTDGKDKLVVESCGYNPQEDGQTQRRSPKGDVMLVAKQELGGVPSVLKSTLLVHPSGDCESALIISLFEFSFFVSVH
jgi:hypothetical protein